LSLALPKELEFSPNLVAGNWFLDHELIDEQGERLKASYLLAENGEGLAYLLDHDGHKYTAKLRVTNDNGELKLLTERFVAKDSPKVYAASELICRQGEEVLECQSPNGKITGEHLVTTDAATIKNLQNALLAQKSKKENEEVSEPKEEFLSLPEAKPRPLPKENLNLVVPRPSEAELLAGQWGFDRDFQTADGKPVHVSFNFKENGEGTATLTTSEGETLNAKATATIDDQVVKIRSSRFTNAQKDRSFPGFFIECLEVNGETICKGTDGWKLWNNEHLLAENNKSRDNLAKIKAKQKTSPKETNQTPSPENSGAEAANQFSELDDGGAELPPEIVQRAEKAKDQPKAANPLVGAWRYSRDLARKSDGSSVALEFHFQESGDGYSLIKDGKDSAKAKAEVKVLPNGKIRVKTSNYQGSDKNYYPTFMECRPGPNKVLDCDVTNGWLRLDHGTLLSLDSLAKEEKEAVAEELVPPKEAKPETNTEDLLAQLSETSPEAKPKDPPKESANLVLPKDDSSMNFLKGKWRCNTGLVRTTDGQPVVMEFAFDHKGKGTSTIIEKNGTVYKAQATALYKNGRLRINTSDFYAKSRRGRYLGQFMECRQAGGRAVCAGHDRNRDVHWQNANFTRLR
ncbi:MAG: hypothetical protein IJS50_05975, partial [Desulfovibrio sp.]|nr:hypothetical protein [Desulfovibrio sp.]